MNINEVNRGIQKHKARKRLGRGIGSGQGKTAGRGHKGAGSRGRLFRRRRSSKAARCPWSAAFPSAASTTTSPSTVAVVNVGDLDEAVRGRRRSQPRVAPAKRIWSKGQYDLLKVLGDGELTKALKISAHRFSKPALEKIQTGRRRGHRAARQEARREDPTAQKQKTAQQA